MKLIQEQYDVGVIVGRFQVPSLHEAHLDLIETVCDAHDKVFIFLGLSPLLSTTQNPLDFESRKQMILAEFPDVNVLYIKDQPTDEGWSKSLDSQVNDLLSASQSVILYGGRDSFISHYKGKYATGELESDVIISATEIRKEVARSSARKSEDFRAGVISATFNRFPTAFTCVDVAIFNEDDSEILLGKKGNEPNYRLIGGFSDPNSPSFEADARREVSEETHLDITDPIYLNSFLIDDWRYKREQDVIKTLLFAARRQSGSARPDDDIAELRWFKVADLDIELDVMPLHRPLVKRAIRKEWEVTVKSSLDK